MTRSRWWLKVLACCFEARRLSRASYIGRYPTQMFWPVVLPFQLTCLLFLFATGVFVLYAPRRNRRRIRVFLVCIGTSLLLFIPACMGIAVVVDHFRFGRFAHSDYDQINDFRVQQYMPPAASKIDLEKYASGFRAKFEIAPVDLDLWIDDQWRRYGKASTIPRDEHQHDLLDKLDYTAHLFEGMPWQPEVGCQQISGPVAGNGAGFKIWFNRENGTAYEYASYW